MRHRGRGIAVDREIEDGRRMFVNCVGHLIRHFRRDRKHPDGFKISLWTKVRHLRMRGRGFMMPVTMIKGPELMACSMSPSRVASAYRPFLSPPPLLDGSSGLLPRSKPMTASVPL